MVDIIVSGASQASLQAAVPALPGISLELTTGKQIAAVVRYAIDEIVWLDIGGKTLLARTETPLAPQQNVTLEVAELTPSRVWLKVVDSSAAAPQTDSAGPVPQSTAAKLEALLSSWGLASDDINMEIATTLLSLHQSVSAEEVLTLRSQWLSFPPQAQPGLETLVFLNDRRIPVGEESLAAAQHWLDSLPPVAQQISELQSMITDARLKLTTLSGDPQALIKLNTTLQNLNNQIADWLVSMDKPAADITARLAGITTMLGNPPENELIAFLFPAAAPEHGAGNAGPLRDEQGAAIARLLPFTEDFLVKGKLPEITETALAKEFVAPKLELRNPLNNLAAVLNDALAGPDLSKPAKEVLHRLLDQVNSVAKDLGAVHVANLNSKIDPGVEPFLVFPIPLNFKDSPQTAYLKIYHDPGQAKPNPENMRLALLLDLPDLGEIAFDFSVFKQRLNGKVISGRPQTHQLVESDLEVLRQRLNTTGYHIDSLTCSILEEQHPEEVETPRFINDTSVDVSI